MQDTMPRVVRVERPLECPILWGKEIDKQEIENSKQKKIRVDKQKQHSVDVKRRGNLK